MLACGHPAGHSARPGWRSCTLNQDPALRPRPILWTLSPRASCAALECAPSWPQPARGSGHAMQITEWPPHLCPAALRLARAPRPAQRSCARRGAERLPGRGARDPGQGLCPVGTLWALSAAPLSSTGGQRARWAQAALLPQESFRWLLQRRGRGPLAARTGQRSRATAREPRCQAVPPSASTPVSPARLSTVSACHAAASEGLGAQGRLPTAGYWQLALPRGHRAGCALRASLPQPWVPRAGRTASGREWLWGGLRDLGGAPSSNSMVLLVPGWCGEQGGPGLALCGQAPLW